MKNSHSADGMEALLGHAVVQPRAKTGEAASETRAAAALGVQILGALGERPLLRTWRARAADGAAVAFVAIVDSAKPAERERMANAVTEMLAAGTALTGIQRIRAVAPSRDAFVADLWTTGHAGDLSALKWPLRRRLEFVRRVAVALEALHRRRLVHGALCATNVLLDDDFQPVLSEAAMVGVHALAARTKDAALYLDYASPAVRNGEPPDVRSDVFSAGRLLEELVKGDEAPDVAEILKRCVSPSGARYESAAALAAALGVAIERLQPDDRPVPAPPAPRPPQPPPQAAPAHARPAREPAASRAEIVAPAMPASSDLPGWTTTRWPAYVGVALLLGAVAGALLVGGGATGMRDILGLAAPLGAALATWFVPPLSARPAASRFVLAVAIGALAVATDPLSYAYRAAASRAIHGDEASRGAAIEEIVRLGRDFRGISLAGVDLTNLDLTGADLRGVDLSHARLAGTRLWGAEVYGASFDGAELEGTNLEQTSLAQAVRVDTASCDDKTRLPAGWQCSGARVTRGLAP